LRAALIAIDQGTTSTRAIAFDAELNPLATVQRELRQIYPAPGEVEHDLEEIWSAVVTTVRDCMAQAGLAASDVAAIGISNQRETCAIWERTSGRPIHNAIVWQDRRTATLCDELRRTGCEPQVADSTGLLLDPYFSASKIAWLLDTVPGARARAEAGELAFGTIDSFLLWRLTGGRAHATDATNAARTLLFDISRGTWDPDLCRLFGVPAELLPQVRDCAGDFGTTDAGLFGGQISIRGVAGDQQAATIGHGCFKPGMIKSTYGTGAFVVLNTGEARIASRHRLLTTIAYQIDGKRTYALEGAIFMAGAAVQWLRDGLGIIAEYADADVLAARADPAQQVYIVPAFVGLGAPHWDSQARAAIHGLTRGAGRAEIARATLESIGYQTADLVSCMRADCGEAVTAAPVLRVDGGMTASETTMQFLADILASPVERPVIKETTALGAAYLAGRAAGLCPEPAGFAAQWKLDRRFEPRMGEAERARKYAAWKDAVRRTLSVEPSRANQ
jgi:glycerol kinase